MRRRSIAVAGLVLLLVVAGAVVSARDGGRDSGDDAAALRQEAGAAEPAVGTAGGGFASAPDSDSKLVGPVPRGTGTIDPAGPRVVRTADIAVEVDEGRFGGAFDRVASIASANGGYVTSSSTATTDDRRRARSGQLTVRVPSDRFEDTRRALGQLGDVEQESLRGEDVSGQLVDYEARLRSLSAQEESLRALLGRAGSVGEVLQVQTALFDVRQQIEQLEAQRTQLDQAASLATIQVSLYEPGALLLTDPRPEPATGLVHSFERALDGAVSVLGGMIVVLGWLAPLAGLAGIGWLALRLRRRPAPPAVPATP